jgi:hypothetical protein
MISMPLVLWWSGWGLEAASAASLVRHAVTIPLVLLLMRRTLHLGAKDQLKGTVAPLLAGAAMAGAVLLVDHAMLAQWTAWPRLVGIVATGAVIYGATILMLVPRLPLSMVRAFGAGLRA